MNICERETEARRNVHLESSDMPVCDRHPHVLLLGGQDAPTTDQLIGRWCASVRDHWPEHDLSVIEWPRLKPPPVGRKSGVQVIHGSSRRPWFDVVTARWVRACIEGLEPRMRISQSGEPEDWLSSVLYGFTRFSVDALYNRERFGERLIAKTVHALRARPIDLIVAHSFGGTLALRAAWELANRGDRGRDFSLITLGSASGPMVVNSPMFRELPRSADGICLPHTIRSWQHFYSESDALVAAPALPRAFAGVQLVRVDTGRLLCKARGHSLTRYLAAPEVDSAFCAQLTAASERALARPPVGSQWL